MDPPKLLLAEVGPLESDGGSSSSGGGSGALLAKNVCGLSPTANDKGGSMFKPTWSPMGGLLAYSSLQPNRMAVVVVRRAACLLAWN